MKDLFRLIITTVGGLVSLLGILLIYGFIFFFITIVAYDLFSLEYGPLYSLFDALWRTILTSLTGFLLSITGLFIIQSVDA